eukprot:gnl/MRDRNA2_/MRDRNA2_180189_c0_seq1.p1 gnl/MRDRNA2_/MRDRNA2_180189_c0~~gnl/MRDRNA2_/MRDRNA2_180189_c0_seq1.p1  ORF type:complete len:239 (+),score=8.41 gnl/MRDRNA2_/MRDRNA2_180189_c0_seq1:115-831(+)
MKHILFVGFILISLSLVGQEPVTHNTIVVNEESVTHKFQTSQELLDTKTKDDIHYYWFKSNELHSTSGSYSGHLLHGPYNAYYLTKQLKEQGSFEKGVKTGDWKSWYENGEIEEVARYKNGRLHGKVTRYNVAGEKVLEADYKNGLLDGEMVSYERGKLLQKTYYKEGIQIEEKEKATSGVEKVEPVSPVEDQSKEKTGPEKKEKEKFKLFRKKEKTEEEPKPEKEKSTNRSNTSHRA